MKNAIFDVAFWQSRLETAKSTGFLQHAIGIGFNFPFIDELHKEIVKKEIKKGEKVLDVGCGYGRTSLWFEVQDYVGVDFVPEFIAIARQKYPNTDFRCADIRVLPFGDCSFDWGVCVSVKEMVRRDEGPEAWENIQKELKRVCKKVLILEYGGNKEEDIRHYEVI